MLKGKNDKKNQIKIKIWGNNKNAILSVIHRFQSDFPYTCTLSRLLESDQGGYHAFLTLTLDLENLDAYELYPLKASKSHKRGSFGRVD